jgi:hypothetical protein
MAFAAGRPEMKLADVVKAADHLLHRVEAPVQTLAPMHRTLLAIEDSRLGQQTARGSSIPSHRRTQMPAEAYIGTSAPAAPHLSERELLAWFTRPEPSAEYAEWAAPWSAIVQGFETLHVRTDAGDLLRQLSGLTTNSYRRPKTGCSWLLGHCVWPMDSARCGPASIAPQPGVTSRSSTSSSSGTTRPPRRAAANSDF